jgi:hypothetical protein
MAAVISMKNVTIIRNVWASSAVRLTIVLVPIFCIFVVPRYVERAQRKQDQQIRTAYAELVSMGKLVAPSGGVEQAEFFSHHGGSPMHIVFPGTGPKKQEFRYLAYIRDGSVCFKDRETEEVVKMEITKL